MSTEPAAAQADIRFSLANERTALSWARTSLAMTAAAAAVIHLAPERTPPWLTLAASTLLAGNGVVLALACASRYATTRAVIDTAADYRPPRGLWLLAGSLVGVAGIVLVSNAVYR